MSSIKSYCLIFCARIVNWPVDHSSQLHILARRKALTTLQKLEDLIYNGFKETDKRFKETDKRMERLHRQFTKELGGVTDSLGRFSEQGVLAAVKRLFNKRGIELNPLYANFEGHLNGDNMETDIIGLATDCTVLIEVKLRLRQADVEDFLEKKLPRFFNFFPAFRRPILYGGVAGMSIDQGVDRLAYKKGLFVLGQTGDNVRILNDKKFRPRSFYNASENGSAKRKSNHRK